VAGKIYPCADELAIFAKPTNSVIISFTADLFIATALRP